MIIKVHNTLKTGGSERIRRTAYRAPRERVNEEGRGPAMAGAPVIPIRLHPPILSLTPRRDGLAVVGRRSAYATDCCSLGCSSRC